MKRQRHKFKNGFTLVELSIVLVIIGLLIGGILAAQSMISTAKVQSFVRQMQQYDIAVTNHLTKYNTWPGDDDLYVTASRTCGGAGCALKNDGQITDDDDFYNNTWQTSLEDGIYFPELHILDGLKVESCPQIDVSLPAGSYNDETVITKGNGCNTPLGNLGKNNTIFVLSNQLGASNFPGNYYFFADCTGMSSSTGVFFFAAPAGEPGNKGCGMPFTGTEALAYDTKIDDGNPSTGLVLGFYNTYFAYMCFGGGSGNCPAINPSPAYNVSTSGLTYSMVQKVAPNMQP